MKTHIFTVRVDFLNEGEVYGSEQVEVHFDDATVQSLGKTITSLRVCRVALSKSLDSPLADDRIDFYRQCEITNHITEEETAIIIDEELDMSLVEE